MQFNQHIKYRQKRGPVLVWATPAMSLIDEDYLRKYAALILSGAQGARSIAEGESQEGSVDEVVDEAVTLDDITNDWTSNECVERHIASTLRSIPALYEDDDYSAAVEIQQVVQKQQRMKKLCDEGFHSEMHAYSQRVMPQVPAMLDLCDVLDESFDECCETAEVLDRCKHSVSHSVRIIALQRRRENLKSLHNATESVLSWVTKLEAVVTKLQEKDFKSGALMLGARMYTDSGSPLLAREKMMSAPAVAPAAQKPAVQSGPSTTSEAPSAAGDLEAPQAITQVKKPAGRQRSTTIAYMAASHGAQRPALPAAPSLQLSSSPNEKAVARPSHSLQDFIEGIGGAAASTIIGVAALTSYHALKENSTEIIVHAMKAEVGRLFTEPFSPQRFANIIDGLQSLKVRGDSISRFFLDCIEPMISSAMHSALIDVVGDDAGDTWEAVADTLVPSEFHECTVRLAAKLCAVMRSVLQLQQYCSVVLEAKNNETTDDVEHLASSDFGVEEERRAALIVACRFLSSIGVQTLHKGLAAIVMYANQVKLGRGQLDDALHVFRILDVITDVFETACPDGSARSTTGSLRFQIQRLIRDFYQANAVESISKVMQDDTFLPFPASSDDFPLLYPYVMRAVDTDDVGAVRDYLRLAPLRPMTFANYLSGCANSQLTAELSSDQRVNPFFTSLVDVTRTPVVAVDAQPLHLFDGVNIFTFSSFMTCKRIMEMANTVVHNAEAAMQLMESATYLAAVYAWFIVTHFTSATETVPLDVDTSVPQHIRDFARTIREWATRDMSSLSGYPLYSGCACHQWKNRAGLPQCLFAAQERVTAIASLEGVVTCHRLVVCALTPLMPMESLSPIASATEALSTIAKYSLLHGIRRVSINVFPPESTAVVIEKMNLVLNAAPQREFEELSPALKGLLDSVTALHKRLLDLHQGMPFAGAQRLVEQVVFNLCVGMVDGLSRVRKMNDSGRTALQLDYTLMCKKIITMHPSVPTKLTDYVLQYLKAFFAPFPEAVSFVQQHHSVYTAKQLVSLGEKEGFLKKREMEQVVQKTNHEDRLPLFLLEKQ